MTLVLWSTKIAITAPRPFASATAARAASSMVGCEIRRSGGIPASARICRPSSALVPSRRITIGARSSTRRTASTMPLATSSPRVMPPKMLMKIERTFSSWLITSSAAAITSALAPPPMSRKLDAAPPTWLTTSSVDIASPAPLAMMPTEPSRPMYWRSFSLAICSRSSSTSVAPYSAHSGWRNAALSSRLTLASRACTTPFAVGRGLEDQRVDLGQVAVALGEAVVQLDEDVGHAVERLVRDAGVDRGVAGGVGAEPVDRVDVQLDDGVGVRSPRPPRSRRRPWPTASAGASWRHDRA